MKNKLSCIGLASLIFLLGGCITSTHLKCPAFSAKKFTQRSGHNASVFHEHKKQNQTKAVAENVTGEVPTDEGGIIGIGGKDQKGVEMKLPPMFATLQNEDIEGINELLKMESNHPLTLKKENNQTVYIKANSKKDLKRATLLTAKPAYKPEGVGGGRGGVALASGILGIVGFVLAFGWYAGFVAFACAVIAIILGIIGLPSRRTGWAIVGIVLGILTLLFAFIFLHFVFIIF